MPRNDCGEPYQHSSEPLPKARINSTLGGMKAFWAFLTDPTCISQSGSLGGGPMTPIGVLIYAAIANTLAVFSLATGAVIGRRAPTMIDARTHSPEIYW